MVISIFSQSWSFHSNHGSSYHSLSIDHSLYMPAFMFLFMPVPLFVMPSFGIFIDPNLSIFWDKFRLWITWSYPDPLSIFPSCRYCSVHCLYMSFSNGIISFMQITFFYPLVSSLQKGCIHLCSVFYTFWYPLYA